MELGCTHLTLGWGSFVLEAGSRAAGSTPEEEDWIVRAWRASVAFKGEELIGSGWGMGAEREKGWRRERGGPPPSSTVHSVDGMSLVSPSRAF